MTPADHVSSTSQEARVAVCNAGPLLPALILAMVQQGRRAFSLIGDRPIRPSDVEQSTFYRNEDVGRRPSAVLGQWLEASAPGSSLDVIEELPTTKLGWHQPLRGCRFAVAASYGPIFFFPWLDLLNEAAQDTGTPWLAASAGVGTELHLGPTVVPGSTPCFKCYELRYKSNTPHLEAQKEYEAHLHGRPDDVLFGAPAHLFDLLAALAAEEVDRALDAERAPATLGKLVTIDVASFRMEHHHVLRLPRCSTCTVAPSTAATRPWGR